MLTFILAVMAAFLLAVNVVLVIVLYIIQHRMEAFWGALLDIRALAIKWRDSPDTDAAFYKREYLPHIIRWTNDAAKGDFTIRKDG